MFVFFDIDGTLVDYKSAEKAGAAQFYRNHERIFKFPEEEFTKVWSELTDKHFKRYLSRELSFDDQRRCRIKELFRMGGLELSDQEADAEFNAYLACYLANCKPFNDVIPCLSKLQHRQLGIISNGDHQHQIDKLTRAGLNHYFSIVVTSGEVGDSKPNERLFAEACRRVSKHPSECFYVGDDLEIDVLGSKAAGLAGIWINRNQEPHEHNSIINIKSLDFLPAIVNYS